MAFEHVDGVNYNKNQILNVLLQMIAGNHGSPQEALIWWDSTAKRIKYHDGTGVQTVPLTGGGSDASTLGGQTSAYHLSRANHTGSQAASTISDFATAVAAAIPASYATDTEVTNAINAVLGGAPAALDTLDELAAAIGDDANYAASVTTALNARTRKYAALIGGSVSIPVVHSLNTLDVQTQYRRISDNARVYPGETYTDVNTITATFNPAPAANAIRVTVIG